MGAAMLLIGTGFLVMLARLPWAVSTTGEPVEPKQAREPVAV